MNKRHHITANQSGVVLPFTVCAFCTLNERRTFSSCYLMCLVVLYSYCICAFKKWGGNSIFLYLLIQIPLFSIPWIVAKFGPKHILHSGGVKKKKNIQQNMSFDFKIHHYCCYL